MPRFFNRIRKQLAKENRFFQYSRYAIGEILLVVIGILIALQLDNWNQERENEEKVRIVLSDMTVELEANINEVARVMKFYEDRDSTIFLAITNQLTAENYRNNTPGNLGFLTTSYTAATLNNETWTKLMDFSDVIPAEFKGLISRINHLYNVRYEELNIKNEIMQQIIIEYFNHLSENHPWFTPRSSNDGSLEKGIDYFLNSDYHRGKIRMWYVHGILNHVQYLIRYRSVAIEVLNEIKTLLDSSNTYDGEIYFDKETAENVQGAWKSDRFPDYELELKYNEGRLFLKFNQDTISREVFDLTNGKLNWFPPIWYKEVEQENWQGTYAILYFTIIQDDGELILKDYFSKWHKVNN
ncbi:DUF6090 family protein [Robiginitalea sp. IMCC44478]|uniref:DUF6090 family protein n=1 Tax=Robiginitalea sp. IMCC44478 TaxID=3459122 RepID=UPI004041F417